MNRGVSQAIFIQAPSWLLLTFAAAIGIAWAASIFGWDFITGRHPFWQFPSGTIPSAQNDMAQVLVGYYYYAQAPWRVPLFHVAALGAPAGANIIMMDAVPIVALIAKLADGICGTAVNPYGAWLFMCLVLPGVMMALVMLASGVRCALAVALGAVFADTMPALLWQWGHIALQAHFPLVGALALYLFSLREHGWRWTRTVWIAYLIAAYLTNMYLFVMSGVVWLCAVAQRCLDRRMKLRTAVLYGSLGIVAVLSVIALGGQFGAGGGLPFAEYGAYSMNLLSPLLPQNSGWIPQFGGAIDATGDQYEGYNYLGIGLLLTSLLLLRDEAGWLRQNARRHAVLLIALGCLTLYAISHRVYAGHRLLFELPVPYTVNRVLGAFRSSGRFFWLVGYAQIALLLVLAFRRANPLVICALACAAVLQIVDVQPLRTDIVNRVMAGSGPDVLDREQVAHMVGGARRVDVIPSFQCIHAADRNNARELERANMELMLATARANVPTNTVYLARQTYGLALRDVLRAPSRASQMLDSRRAEYCRDEAERAHRAVPSGGVLVLLSDRLEQQETAPGITCFPLSWARYCRRTGN
jgi:hypothetical protein